MMAVATYSEKLKDPRWQAKRLRVFERDKFQCRFCGDGSTTLNVHHLRYEKGWQPWEYALGDLVTLCETCHKREELAKASAARALAYLTRYHSFTHSSLANLLAMFVGELDCGNKQDREKSRRESPRLMTCFFPFIETNVVTEDNPCEREA